MFRRWRRHTPSAPQSNGQYRHGNQHLIELRHVVKTYHTAAGPFIALQNVDLTIDGGEFVAIVGKSGSGKSTLINMLTGIDRPTHGEVLVGDTAVHTLTEGQMAVWRGHNVGVIFQFFQLLPTLTVIENVMLPMDFCNMYTPRERRERAMHLLDRVDMHEQANKLPTAISGGQQQRAAIARALANDPPLLVADEPTGNLDSRTADAVFHLFETLVAGGKTVVMVTHDTDLARRTGRAVLVADGQMVEEEQGTRNKEQRTGTQRVPGEHNTKNKEQKTEELDQIIPSDQPMYVPTSGALRLPSNGSSSRDTQPLSLATNSQALAPMPEPPRA